MDLQNTATPPIHLTITTKGNAAVLASELHARLAVKTPLRKWMPRMLEYGFEEGGDFYRVDKNIRLVQGGSNTAFDWMLTLDTAKEVAMLQRTPAGKAIRNYLIEQDKRVHSGAYLSAEQVTALIDLVNVLGFTSAQKKCEAMHYDFMGKPASWWAYRAKLLGYSAASLRKQVQAVGRRYKSQRAALIALDPCELIRTATMDLFIGLGKPEAYALNMGATAKAIAAKIQPVFDNDLDGGFDFKTPAQKRLISTIGSPALLAKF